MFPCYYIYINNCKLFWQNKIQQMAKTCLQHKVLKQCQIMACSEIWGCVYGMYQYTSYKDFFIDLKRKDSWITCFYFYRQNIKIKNKQQTKIFNQNGFISKNLKEVCFWNLCNSCTGTYHNLASKMTLIVILNFASTCILKCDTFWELLLKQFQKSVLALCSLLQWTSAIIVWGRVTFGIVNQPIQGMVLFTTCCHVVGLWRTFAMFADLPEKQKKDGWRI
jgi:hypothetical protein